jgi:multiple sugar transport system substrate-binding protein
VTNQPDQGPPVNDWMQQFQSGALSRRDFIARLAFVGFSFSAVGSILAACAAATQSGSASAPASAGAGASGAAASLASRAPVTLQVWKYTTPTEDPPAQAGIDRWNAAHPDVQVKMQVFPFGDYVGTKLTTAFAAGNGPDVFWVSSETILDYVNAGIAAPVDDLIKDVRSDFSQASIDAETFDGKLLAIPSEVKPVALFYRKDLLAAAGVTPPTTWDELLSAATKLTTPKQSGLIVEVDEGAYQNVTWLPVLWSAGADVLNADGTASALRTDAAASAFDLWGRFISSGAAPSKVQGGTGDIGHLGRGETAMQICGIWAIGDMKATYPDVDYGIARLPIPPGGTPVTAYGGWSQVVNAKSPNLAQALEFTKGMFVDDSAYVRDWACGSLTSYSPRKSVNDTCETVFNSGPIATMTRDVLPTARAEPRYPAGLVSAVGDGLQAAMFGGKSGQEAATLAADKVDAFLKTYKGAH